MLTDPVGQEFRQGTEMTPVTPKAKDNAASGGLFFSGCLPLEPSQHPASTTSRVGQSGLWYHVVVSPDQEPVESLIAFCLEGHTATLLHAVR